MQCSGVEWNGVDGMQCSGAEWNGNDGMQCSGVECPRKKCFLLFGQSDNFHFSKVAHFFSFCEARSKMASKRRRTTKCHVLTNAFLLWFVNVLLCVLTAVL